MSLRKLSHASRPSIGLRSIWFSWLAIAAVVCGLFAPFNSTSVANAQPTAGFSTAVFKKKPTPKIVGVPEVGSWLTVVIGTWDPGTSLGIQWTRNNSYDLKGQNKTRYLVTSSDVGKRLTVSVTGMKKGYLVHKATSAEVIAFAKGTAPSPAPSGKPSTSPSPTPSPTAPIGKLVNTPIPTIVGNPVVGSELQAIPGNWDSGVQISYQWYRGSSPILGATASRYVAGEPDRGFALKVAANGAKPNFFPVERFSIPTRIVAPATTALVEIPLSTKPLIRGMPKVGQALSFEKGTWTSGVSFSTQWFRNGLPIPGASSANYLLSALDVDAKISVSVTGSLAGHKSLSLVSDQTAGVMQAEFATIGTPSITGDNSVGSFLSIANGTWDKAAQFKIQWLVNGVPRVGETAASFTLLAAELGATISATVTASAPGYQPVQKTATLLSPVVAGAISQAPIPVVTGSVALGSRLTLSTGTWSSGVSLSYQWLRNGTAIAGATSSTYTVVNDDIGTALSVTVSGSKPGFVTISKTSALTGAIPTSTFQSTPAPVIVFGAGPLGRNYQVGLGLVWDEGTSFTYQWLRNGAVIPGATSTSYAVTDQEAGQSLTLSVTGSKSGYVSVTKVSAPMAVPMFKFAKYSTEIRGMFEIGETVGAFPDWDAGTTISLQWTRDGLPILGATEPLYLISPDDGGHKIGLTITGSKPGHLTLTNSIVEKPVTRLMVSSKPFITGNTNYFSTLTANTGLWEDGVRFIYNWRSNFGPPGNTEYQSKIVAHEVSYTPTHTFNGRYFLVCVDGIKAGLKTVRLCSDWFGPMQNNIFPNQPKPRIIGTIGGTAPLSVDTSGWLPDSRFTYAWTVVNNDGTRRSGFTNPTTSSGDIYTKTIKLKIEVSKDGYETVILYDEVSR